MPEKGHEFFDERVYARTYADLDAAGFDQVPCGSNCGTDKNFGAVVEWGRTHVPSVRLKGFCMAPWILTLQAKRQKGLDAVRLVGEARKSFEALGGLA